MAGGWGWCENYCKKIGKSVAQLGKCAYLCGMIIEAMGVPCGRRKWMAWPAIICEPLRAQVLPWGAMIFNGPLFSDTKFSKNFPAIMNCFNIAQPRVGEGQPFSKGQPRASAAIATLTATGEGHQHF